MSFSEPIPAAALTLDIEDLAEPAFGVDWQHRIVAWNRAAHSYFEMDASVVLGQLCHVVLRTHRARPCQYCPVEHTCLHANNADEGDAADENTLASVAEAISTEAVEDHRQRFQSEALPMIGVVGHTPTGEICIVHVVPNASPTPSHVAHDARPVSRRAHQPTPLVVGGHQPNHLGAAPLPRLTSAERRILYLLAEGHTTTQIAASLSITLATTRNHIAHILMKVGASTRLEAVATAKHLGLM